MKHRLIGFLVLIFLVCSPLHAQDLADADAEIQVTDAPQDQAIEKRLTEILRVLATYDEAEINVEAGVVVLTGNVPSARASRELVALANRVEGVVHVQNLLTEKIDISNRIQPATQKMQDLLTSALRTLPVALVALTAVILFWLLAHWVARHGAWLNRIGLSEMAAGLGQRIIRILIIGTGFLIALQILDATALVGALLGIAGMFGLAVGFAFRNIAENYLAGVLLSARNPFNIGDFIQIAEHRGSVVRLTSRDTVLMTGEGNHLRIPNSVMITSVMTNYTRNPLRLFEFKLSISVAADLAQARKLGMTTLQCMKGLLSDPDPQVLINSVHDNAVELHFLAWIDQTQSDIVKARSEAIRLMKSAFDKAGIEFAESVYRIRINGDQSEKIVPLQAGRKVNTVDQQEQLRQQQAVVKADNTDIATDQTINKQVAKELDTSDEENLLN